MGRAAVTTQTHGACGPWKFIPSHEGDYQVLRSKHGAGMSTDAKWPGGQPSLLLSDLAFRTASRLNLWWLYNAFPFFKDQNIAIVFAHRSHTHIHTHTHTRTNTHTHTHLLRMVIANWWSGMYHMCKKQHSHLNRMDVVSEEKPHARFECWLKVAKRFKPGFDDNARSFKKRRGGSWVEPLPTVSKWKLNASKPWITGDHNNAGTPDWPSLVSPSMVSVFVAGDLPWFSCPLQR